MISAPLHNVLFLDIETAPQYPHYDEVPDNWRALWDLKSATLLKHNEGSTNSSLYPRAGIYAEFGKIICISCGVLQGSGSTRKLVIKSFSSDDEKSLLISFIEMFNKWSTGETKFLCAHNGKEFDFPYLCRRMIVHHLSIPSALNCAGKKPWEVPHLDTLELWKFGDFKNYTSLNLLAHTLGIQTPKNDIDGSMVWEVYWKDKDLQRIVNYCQKDVVTVAQIILRLKGEQLISEENIEIKA
jgi:3'-5' exonuclease